MRLPFLRAGIVGVQAAARQQRQQQERNRLAAQPTDVEDVGDLLVGQRGRCGSRPVRACGT